MSHAPKLAALMAYDAEVLSDAGRRRIETHLEGCEVCREALASMRVFDELRADLEALPLPSPDYARMELPLRREARQSAAAIQDQRLIMPSVLLSVAAAALFFVWVTGHADEAMPQVQRGVVENAETPPEAPRPTVVAELTAVAGAVLVDGERVGAPGAPMAEGGALITEERSEAHIRFAEGTGAIAHAHTELEAQELRRGQVTLTLSHGTVANEVAHLGEGDRYEVHAGAYVFRVRGTRFAVSRKAEDVALVVAEGVVEVLRDGRLEATVEAPGEWRSGFVVWGPAQVRHPVGLGADASGWPVLSLAPPEGTRRMRVSGQDYAGLEGLALRVPAGPTRVELVGPDGSLTTRMMRIDANGVVDEGTSWGPDAPPAREGFLSPALIAPPVRAGMRRLEGCHRQEARRGAPPSGVFSLRVTIGLTGRVSRAQLIQRAGEPPTPAFRQCVVEEARRWSFPPPTGGTVTFDQPLRFTTRMP